MSFSAKNLNEDGTVTVFDLIRKSNRRCSPIDAREMLAMGTASLTNPDEESSSNSSDDNAVVVDFAFFDDGFTVPELQELCKEHKINFKGLNKPAIIEKLLEAGVTPEGAES